ncbi:dihydrodipicolinate reductase [Abditibacterium utsteinense]|uniref:4-hydroxy-tetrahydrodipicolinate reductase n=1 Tax=Abditibacterium utsteinense TaxID=1960156 RepID=A0A2S8SSN2_9BACT|nr:4-hydroxy-tetrahydrodipicolinate reductase [Abditibacterium utsteinense]PQV63824.1 dihydrodipicolinate reductase [Abditibacterium utsteinense]
MISVLLVGAAGRMGREVVKAVSADGETELVTAVGCTSAGRDAGEVAGIGTIGLEIQSDLQRAIAGSNASVAVDFSVPSAVKSNIAALLEAKIAPVIGATGLSQEDLAQIDISAKNEGVPVLFAPNFAIGAILMMRFASEAAKYFEMAEILEYHHEKKLDAPSGTAFQTALKMREAKGEDFVRVGGDSAEHNSTAVGARGGEIGGISIHSIRLPGFLAHQEVVFGMPGQTLNIRHDTITRECYMPGVLLAIKRVRDLSPGLHFGLEKVM